MIIKEGVRSDGMKKCEKSAWRQLLLEFGRRAINQTTKVCKATKIEMFLLMIILILDLNPRRNIYACTLFKGNSFFLMQRSKKKVYNLQEFLYQPNYLQ